MQALQSVMQKNAQTGFPVAPSASPSSSSPSTSPVDVSHPEAVANGGGATKRKKKKKKNKR